MDTTPRTSTHTTTGGAATAHPGPEAATRRDATDPSAPLHVVLGAGPVGTTLAQQLVARGLRVRTITRSGTGLDHPLAERMTADVADAAALRAATEGASVIYNAVNPPYHRWPELWPPMHRAAMAAATAHGAVLVLMDNLYSYGPTGGRPLSPDLPQAATDGKGRVRAEMADELLAAHRAGTLRATIARASDFVGPLVTGSHLGDRVVPRVLAGKGVQLLGSLDQPHSFAYMPDVARTLVALGSDERAWGRVWHVPSAPAVTQREAVQRLAQLAGTTVKIGTLSPALLRVAGLVVPMLRELRGTAYQFEEPFVIDAAETEQAFGITATPLDEALAATLAWYRTRAA